MDKPTKPTNLIPRSFGGVKNNWSASMQLSGYEDGVPAIYGGDNLNYQLDATGKELDYCEKICDYINAIPINKTPIVDANNKLVYTQYDIRVYSANETYYIGDYVTGVVDSVKHIYQSLQNNNIGQSLSNETYWKKVDIISDIQTIGRNIGEVVTSTIPLTDAGLHLLDGALISGSGSYAEFVTYISGLVSTHPDLFTTESNWQTSVTTYGVCGKFVYDSVNNTVRLPKYSNKIYTKDIISTAQVKGNGKGLTLTNGTNTFTFASRYNERGDNGSLYGVSGANAALKTGNQGSFYSGVIGVGTNGETSGLLADLSNITTSLEGYYYIVIATSTKTDIQVDIDEIATDLNGKADTDLSNVPESKGILVEKSDPSIMPRWYRVYSDGWCEQGGEGDPGTTDWYGITLLKPYKDTNYQLLATNSGNSNTIYTIKVGDTPTKNTNTTAYVKLSNADTGFRWQASGYIR